jgi:rfaE bifunctional protein nucleotidyltransferase chain/domain
MAARPAGQARTAARPLVIVGDALLDRDIDGDASRLAPDAPAPVVEVRSGRSRPGGAGLAATLAARSGREVVLVTALGGDRSSRVVRDALGPRIKLVELPLRGTLPVKTRIRVGGRPLLRLDHGAGTPADPLGAEALAAVRDALADASAVLVSDYGRGTALAVRDLLADAARHGLLVWDPHPRGATPVPGTRLATPNAAEARHFAAGTEDDGDSLHGHAARGARLAARWQAAAVAITLGARGALLTRGSDSPMLVPAPHPADGDPCGAGDCFAAAAAAALADGALPEEAVRRGVAEATAFIADDGCTSGWRGARDLSRPEIRACGRHADPFALVDAVRARGGTVVAAGGCFDLLHAGHVGLLESARRIGDCLVVCLNSDASVARLKGPGRPLMPQADRARVLTGLGCVDAVAVFDDDTPEPLLRKLRPDVWVKGGDYTADALPEAAALREWGGQALVLPYLDGRSTTELARRAARAPGPRR